MTPNSASPWAWPPEPTLQALRERAGLSQRELARRAGVASNTIRNAELGAVTSELHRDRIDRALRAALVLALIDETLNDFDGALVAWPEEAAT